MTLAISGGTSQLLSGARLLALLTSVDGVGSHLDADTIRALGALAAPAIPGGTSGTPLYGQVFARKVSPYPGSLFRI